MVNKSDHCPDCGQYKKVPHRRGCPELARIRREQERARRLFFGGDGRG